MTVSFLSRSAWGAGPLKAGHRVGHDQFKGLVIHHTVMIVPDYDRDGIVGGDIDDIIRFMRVLQDARPDLGPEVPYSFVVFPGATPTHCVVAEGRGFGVTGAHTAGFNSSRYGCAYGGNASVESITPGVIEGFNWIGARLNGSPVATIGHRDTKATECPGDHLYALLGRIQPPFTNPEDDDMPLSKDDLFKIRQEVIAALADPTHQYLQDELKPIKTDLAALKDMVQRLLDDG